MSVSRRWTLASMIETDQLTLNSGSQNSIREVRLGGLGESEERLKESSALAAVYLTIVHSLIFIAF